MFVTGCWPPLSRHSLVWLAEEPAARLAAEHWRRGLPFVLCRRRDGEELSLGFCLPPGTGGKPSRHALAVHAHEIGMVARPPLLGEVMSVLPAWKTLLPLPASGHLRVFGSAMWEYLTHETFLRTDSDLDLLWELRAGDNPAGAIEFFERADALLPGRIDGEISFPGGGEVAWREWASSSPKVVLKSMAEVVLVPRGLLLDRLQAAPRPARSLARAAVEALLEELELYPKPGLVSAHDSGSHADMDYLLMRNSAESLFEFLAEIETNPGDFQDCLKPIGLRAERRMLEVTGGVNTHRGAIFLLGLLVAATARADQPTPAAIRESLLRHYGPALQEHDRTIPHPASHGAAARALDASTGARREAAHGFPAVFATALPHFQTLLADGICRQAAALETLLLLMARTGDSNLLHRGGKAGAAQARAAAAKFLQTGGVRRNGWFQELQRLHADFVENHWSPGGCADLLAAVLFLERVSRYSPRFPSQICGLDPKYPNSNQIPKIILSGANHLK